ncbi:hypothetical protein ACFVYE_32035 [Streptomyces sp. NPDC058239]|uniref:hypothetical protein n=1 Tax=Streptomyces sp. NPDC058239 TaxID=3346395 RepID=UPI0036EC7663
MVQHTDTGPVANTTELLTALTQLGLLTRPFTPEELTDEEKNAGGAELLRLRMAHALAGLAEMQVMHAAVAAGEAGHEGTALILAADYLYEGANLGHDDGGAQTALLYLLARRLEDLLTSRTAAIQRGDDIALPLLVMPAMGIAGSLSTVLGLISKDPAHSVQAEKLRETASQLHGMAEVLEEFVGRHENAARDH